ncbi:fasciclin domain-containing protein [Bacteroides congonensis]
MKNKIGLNLIAGLLMLCFFNACEDPLDGTVYQTTEQQMIDEYMADNMGEFLKIVDKSDYRGMLHAYGAYTCLAPTDNAVRKYLEENRIDIEQLSTEEANECVGYHVINDTITSSRFQDGKMPTANIRDYFLTTQTKSDENGNVYVEVDRNARLLTKDVILGNGILHVVDAVLKKPELTLCEQVAALPMERYSLFIDLFAEYEDYLNSVMTADTCYTVYVQSNETFNSEGIYNKSELVTRLKQNTPGVNDTELLVRNFLAYHVGTGRQYVVDLMGGSAVMTKVENQVIACIMDGQKIVLNRFNSIAGYEPGIELMRDSEYADRTCADGVLQEVDGMLEIKERAPYRVNFDVCTLPEIKASASYLKEEKKFERGQLTQDIKIEYGRGSSTASITYKVGQVLDKTKPKLDQKMQCVNGDYLTFRMSKKEMITAVEFTLPLLIEGTYKVWLCYRHTDGSKVGPTLKTTFKQEGQDDQVLDKIITVQRVSAISYVKGPDGKEKTDERGVKMVDHAAMETNYGWKQYTYHPHNYMNSNLLGVIKVFSSGRHVLRFDLEKDDKVGIMLDMIQFIPTTEDQVWPMLDMTGMEIGEFSPGKEEIWPYE